LKGKNHLFFCEKTTTVRKSFVADVSDHPYQISRKKCLRGNTELAEHC